MSYEEKIELVDAGHPAPILYKKQTGECNYVELGKKSVGAIGIAGFPVYYESMFYEFEDGDELIMFSDGVIDIKNEKDEYFGKERLLEAVKLNIGKTAAITKSPISNRRHRIGNGY